VNVDVLRNKVAVVGIGSVNFGEMYRDRDEFRTAESLGARAFKAALDDAGLQKDAIDGLCIHRVPSYQYFSAALGMKPGQLRHISHYAASGRFSGIALQDAAMSIASGMAETVVCVYGNNGRSARETYGGGYGGEGSEQAVSFETVYGMTSPGAAVAHAYSRYMKTFNVPDGALAPLALNNRKNAMKNPLAVMRDELTLESYLGSRFIAEPLRLFDYCLINDGAVAVILTTPERARDLNKPSVLVTAIGASATLATTYQAPDNFWASAVDVSDRGWSDSGLRPGNIDVASIYDNFTPTILFSLEAFGYCKRGEAWEWVKGGRIEAGGELPLNTSGGHTSESYMQGWNHIIELVRQIRGESVNQVPDCEFAHYACYSPITSSIIFSKG
jgi:acetyl-CoA acetyltransferase